MVIPQKRNFKHPKVAASATPSEHNFTGEKSPPTLAQFHQHNGLRFVCSLLSNILFVESQEYANESRIARRLCPELVIVPVNFTKVCILFSVMHYFCTLVILQLF